MLYMFVLSNDACWKNSLYDPQSHTMACQGLFYLSISDELSKNSEQGKKNLLQQ